MTERPAALDPQTRPIGLGCMGMSEFYGPADDAQSLDVLHRALDLGVALFDTADMYGQGHNERLISLVARQRRAEMIIATKCGIVRGADPADRRIDTSPNYIRAACEASLLRLGVDEIDLFYLHRLDGVTPVEESAGALGELAREGKIRAAGLCEVNADSLRRACSEYPIAALQSEYSLTSREPEREMLALCRELGVVFVAYSPLGRGLLSGALPPQGELAANDVRRNGYLPRFAGDAFERNRALAAALTDVAAEKGVTPAQAALAWVIARPGVIAIPGTRSAKRLKENLAAATIVFTDAELSRIERAVPDDRIEGARYDPVQSRTLDR